MLQIIIKDGTVEPFQQDPEALTTQLALAHLVAHLLGRTPSLQIFQITFSLPAHKCSANRHEAQRKCKAFARPATTDGRETQPKFREPRNPNQTEPLPSSINIRSHRDTTHAWSACNEGHASQTFSRRRRMGAHRMEKRVLVSAQLLAARRNRPGNHACCELSNGSRCCCMRLSGRAQPTQRSQKRALKSSKNSLTAGCCQGSYTTTVHTHFSHFISS
jgi:hypothetical protein